MNLCLEYLYSAIQKEMIFDEKIKWKIQVLDNHNTLACQIHEEVEQIPSYLIPKIQFVIKSQRKVLEYALL